MYMTCSCNNTEVNDILLHLPPSLKGLKLVLNKLKFLFPVPPIDLTNISHLVNLEHLQIIGGSVQSGNGLNYNSNTFQNLTKVQELRINVIIGNTDLTTIMKQMKHLEIIDLSNTNRLCMSNVQKLVRSLTTAKLNKLVLRSFQMSGMSCYNNYLNISAFFTLQQSRSIEHLDLSRNNLGVIYPSMIAMLPNLKTLDISHNYLLAWTNDALLIEMLLHPTLEVLDMESQGSGYQTNYMNGRGVVNKPLKFTEEFPSGRYDRKTLFRNLLFCINSNTYGNFSNLFNDSMILCSTIRCIGQMSSHILEGIPCEAFGNLPDTFDSSCPFFIRFQIAKSLKNISAGNLNWINRPTPKLASNLCMNKSPLKAISAGQNGNWIKNHFIYGLIEKVTVPAALKNLEQLDLSQNDLDSFPKWTLKSLHTLNLAHNHIKSSNTSVCMKYPNLKNLTLSWNNISGLDGEWLGECIFLKDLDLSHNSLNLTRNPLSIVNNTKLININLNGNEINTLPKLFTEQLEAIARYQDQNHVKDKLRITFSENNLLCLCNADTISFLIWFQSASIIIPDNSSYLCSSSHGKMSLNDIDIKKFRNDCFPSYSTIIVESVVSTVSIILVFVILAAMYRYRWRLQYRLIQTTKTIGCFAKGIKDSYFHNDVDCDEKIKYDAFVSYCADDRFWVHDCLMKTLESSQYGLKLCIHYRDFPLGEDISTVIIRSIRQSRKLIIVLSEQSLGRPWCQFEFQVALSEAIKRQIKLAVIKLGQFKVEEVDDSSVAWVLDNHTYLEWHENENAQKVFWFKLLRYVNNDTEGPCCCFGSRSLRSDDITAFAENNENDEDMLGLLE